MTGLENILSGIKKDSDLAAESIINAAEEKASLLKKEAEEEVEKIMKAEAEKAEADAEEIIKRAKSSGELNTKKVFLAEKQRLIAEVIALAKKKLEGLEGKAYFDVLEKIISKNLRNENGEIVLTKADSKNMTDEFEKFLGKSDLKVSENYLSDGEKGCIIIYSNSNENCTFDELFEAYSESVSDMAQSFLFD